MLKLPTIEAHPNNVPREGQRIDSQFVRSGMQLIKSAPQLAALFDLELVDIRPVGNWGVLCRYSNNLLATFDLSQLERCERDFLKILKTTHAKGLTLETINLAPTKNIPVTFRNKNVEW